MLKGKIILVYFPFTDLTGKKLRPALVLYDGSKDVIVAFISSKKYEAETDILISSDHPEFKITGLKKDSVLKLSKIATLNRRLIAGEIGKVGPLLSMEINKKIHKILTL